VTYVKKKADNSLKLTRLPINILQQHGSAGLRQARIIFDGGRWDVIEADTGKSENMRWESYITSYACDGLPKKQVIYS